MRGQVTQQAFYSSCGDAMEDADTSCHTRKRCCLPWECLFDLTEVHCPRDVFVDGTVYCRHAGCRKQHFAAPAACQGLQNAASFPDWEQRELLYVMLCERLISCSRYFSQHILCRFYGSITTHLCVMNLLLLLGR